MATVAVAAVWAAWAAMGLCSLLFLPKSHPSLSRLDRTLLMVVLVVSSAMLGPVGLILSVYLWRSERNTH